MRKFMLAATLLCSACGSAGTSAPPMQAGAGIKVDPGTQTISVDPTHVPALPGCGPGLLVMSGETPGTWRCGTAAPDASQLGGLPAAAYATKDATVANAQTLGSHPATDFLLAAATAVDSAKLGGLDPSSFAAATGGVANDSAKLGGLTPDNYAAATAGVANDSAKLGGQLASAYATKDGTVANASKLGSRDPGSFADATAGVANNSSRLAGLSVENFVQQDPMTHEIRLQGDILSGDHRQLFSNSVCVETALIGPIGRPRCVRFATTSLPAMGTFCGQAAATTGLFADVLEPSSTSFSASGYRAGKINCEKASGCGSNAHMCTAVELARTAELKIGIPIQDLGMWIAAGNVDCVGWTSATGSGSIWFASPGLGSCATARTVACCH